MKQSKAVLRELARRRVDLLLAFAVNTAKDDFQLAKRQAAIARRISMKFNLHLPYQLKRFYCRGCKQLIIPGVNARVRLGFKPRALKVTCLDCGHVYRRILEDP